MAVIDGIVNPHPQPQVPHKFVVFESISPTQGATRFVDCLVWIQGEAKQGGSRKWS